MAFVLVYSTFGDRESAASIARQMVEERLAACASLMPGVTSIYHWEGAVEEASEVLVLFKTKGESYPALEARLKELHPYDLPEIIAVPIQSGLPAYLEWVAQETMARED